MIATDEYKPEFNWIAGKNCEINVDNCANQPCHHGHCIDGVDSFTCVCQPGFTGQLCQVQINECLSTPSPCMHGGQCVDLVGGFECKCPAGTGGLRCENNVNDCFSNPCQNKGKCIDGINRYTCECPDGYAGQNCGKKIFLVLNQWLSMCFLW